MALAPSQQAQLEQLHAITNGDLESEQAILESVGWDVQRAIEAIFDAAPSQSTSTARTPTRHIEQMEIDDSNVQHVTPSSSGPSHSLLSLIGRLFAFPLVTTFNILAYIIRLLRIPIPRLNLNLNWNFFSSLWTPRRRDNPGVAAERWVRELEAEVGGRRLPEFYLGSYEDALSVARRELRIMCVVLVSEEHDDVPAFKRETLADPNFVSTIMDNNILLWGGDVSSIEPYSASLKLGATTYPFVAFIAVQPARLPSAGSTPSSTTRSALSILSRFSGASQTTSQQLTNHITETLIPRVNNFLDRLKTEERARQHDRLERAESERRAEASAAADSARIARKREEERQRKREEEERAKLLVQKQNLEVRRRQFWSTCGVLLPPEPPHGYAGSVRITLRTPSGQRIVRSFSKGDSLESLFRWSASTLAPSTSTTLGDAKDKPYNPREEGWGFSLATSYPRVSLPWQDWPTTISTIADGVLKDGGMIVVELDSGSAVPAAGGSRLSSAGGSVSSTPARTQGDDNDEYLSEED